MGVSGVLGSTGLTCEFIKPSIFSYLYDSVLTQPASLILHNKEATAHVENVKVALPASHLTPAAPFDSFTAAPILLKSLLSALVGILYFFALFSETFSQLKLI